MSNVVYLGSRRNDKSSTNVEPPSADTRLLVVNSLLASGYVVVGSLELEFDDLAGLWKFTVPTMGATYVSMNFWYSGDTPKLTLCCGKGKEAKHTDARRVPPCGH